MSFDGSCAIAHAFCPFEKAQICCTSFEALNPGDKAFDPSHASPSTDKPWLPLPPLTAARTELECWLLPDLERPNHDDASVSAVSDGRSTERGSGPTSSIMPFDELSPLLSAPSCRSGAIAGMALSPRSMASPRGATPRAPGTPVAGASPRGAYANLDGTDVYPRSPRAAAAAIAAARQQRISEASAAAAAGLGFSPRSFQSSGMNSSRAQHMQREAEIRAMVNQAQNRMQSTQQRDKLRKMMQSISDEKEEVPVSDLILTAELANIPLSEQQRELFFKTPYAQRYSAAYDTNSHRSNYGLECTPRSVKWRAFDEALRHSKIQNAEGVDKALEYYLKKEAKSISDERAREEEARRLAEERAKAGTAAPAKQGITDEQLRMVHGIVKQRLSTQFAEIRGAFRSFDKDHSGNISAAECTDALLSLNVGVPRKWIDHLVNVADYDRDGEINYQEFARILTCDDITKFKKEGAEEEGLVDNTAIQWYDEKKGITKKEMMTAQTKMRDMLLERGGLTKMFRIIDEDKSGWCSRKEMRALVLNLNLETIIRPAIIEELINLMDVDGDDQILYKEFARVITAEDVFHMEKLVEKVEEKKVKLTAKQKKLQQKRAIGLM